MATFAETSLKTGVLGELGASRMKLQMRAEGLRRVPGTYRKKGGDNFDKASLKLQFNSGPVVNFLFFILQDEFFYW